ncbi:MAG: lasso peptide biosynthesis B2 protein [Candidatus Riflebacteria bacterium]|nr:lasso peptide biosynthesis B2 protein [Candidatus Riflebacteria bacterium]
MKLRDWPALSDLGSIAQDTLVALAKAWQVRVLRRDEAGVLPPVSDFPAPGPEVRDRIARLVGRLVFCLTGWKPGRCYYRAFALAYVLRRRGVPLVLNLGCQNYLEVSGRAQAHCWLTLEGQPFAEDDDPSGRYPIPIGEVAGKVRYWLGGSGVEVRRNPLQGG